MSRFKLVSNLFGSEFFYRALVNLITGVGGSDDLPYIVNPARHDPNLVTNAQLVPGQGPVAVFKKPTQTRVIHTMIGIALSANIKNATQLSIPTTNGELPHIKQIILLPLRKEYERAMAYHGMVFNKTSLVVSTFGVPAPGTSERTIGVVFRTMFGSPNAEFKGPSKCLLSSVYLE